MTATARPLTAESVRVKTSVADPLFLSVTDASSSVRVTVVRLIGSSHGIRAVRDHIERVATTDFTVLIEGGSGPQPHPGFIEV